MIEPLTNYFVSRMQRDFNHKNTFIGGIFTATNRKIEENVSALHKSAYTAGFDFKHQWKNRSWYIGGNVVTSRVEGNKVAILNTQTSIRHLYQRVDASHLKWIVVGLF